ncbi:hypothetical protein [Asanoa siamensis]|uniref:Uncharacterized protein n=1 Tax=Asanoa siamensis TaxID=926357 RepID=A0ABQ4CWT0_9ACTN|nr:hypothetical protein [Asanoa siamensis]GIF75747.1 hypothetical protein Asi02nite_52650 [Asanoa siamensis]
MIRTGIQSGRVIVTLETLNSAPDVDTSEWEASADIDFESSGNATLLTWEHDIPDWSFPLTTTPGSYRLRVAANGRGVARDLVIVDEPTEAYLVQIWPQAEQGPFRSVLVRSG